ncbi:MAG: hypothetical protein EZS28_029008, partial [Streblomastix strix]
DTPLHGGTVSATRYCTITRTVLHGTARQYGPCCKVWHGNTARVARYGTALHGGTGRVARYRHGNIARVASYGTDRAARYGKHMQYGMASPIQHIIQIQY